MFLSAAALDANVVIRIGSVPIERFGYRTTRNAGTHDVRQISSLCGMNGEEIIDGRVRCHDYGCGSYNCAAAGLNASALTAFNLTGMCARVDKPLVTRYCASESGEVFERMKLSLPREANARPGIV